MKVHLTTLSNHLYQESRERLCNSALRVGIESIFSFDFDEIKASDFYKKNQAILSNVKFLGYWLWKPFIIADTLNKVDEGDVLIYADAGAEIIQQLDWLVNHCQINEPIILFGNATDINASWTKRDCFVMMDCDSPEYWFSPHCDASFMLFRKCQQTVDFVNQWLNYGCNENIITDLPNISGKPNLEEYRDHRYDQSILSLLAQKSKLNLYRIPSQFGNHYKTHELRVQGEFNCPSQWNQTQVSYYSVIPYYNSDYSQLVNHHRTKKVDVSAQSKYVNRPLHRRILSKVKSVLISFKH